MRNLKFASASLKQLHSRKPFCSRNAWFSPWCTSAAWPILRRCKHCRKPWPYLARFLARLTVSTVSSAGLLGLSLSLFWCPGACTWVGAMPESEAIPLFTCCGPWLILACFTKATCRGYFNSTTACIVAGKAQRQQARRQLGLCLLAAMIGDGDRGGDGRRSDVLKKWVSLMGILFLPAVLKIN